MKTEKERESRVRSKLKSAGLALRKSRSRHPSDPSFGTYRIVDPILNTTVRSGFQTGFGMSLDEVEEYALPEGADNVQ